MSESHNEFAAVRIGDSQLVPWYRVVDSIDSGAQNSHRRHRCIRTGSIEGTEMGIGIDAQREPTANGHTSLAQLASHPIRIALSIIARVTATHYCKLQRSQCRKRTADQLAEKFGRATPERRGTKLDKIDAITTAEKPG